LDALNALTSIEEREFETVDDLVPLGEEVEPLPVVVLVWEWELVGDDPISVQRLPVL
jgi:hypothetical protein